MAANTSEHETRGVRGLIRSVLLEYVPRYAQQTPEVEAIIEQDVERVLQGFLACAWGPLDETAFFDLARKLKEHRES